jgi:endonuclease/exonuclease/phosphatase family metal-dependent hydrolase
LLIWAYLIAPVAADTLRIATYNTELQRKGPGLLLRDMVRGDKQVQAVAEVIVASAPDILLLQGIDYDHGALALQALQVRLAEGGLSLPYHFALRPNSGWQTGLDLDGDGHVGGARDAQGFGRFSGQGGMALLSRYPVASEEVRDFSTLFWTDLPMAVGPTLADVLRKDHHAVQRLSSVAHWLVPVDAPQGRLTLLAFHAGPPVFDGPEDRNGYRNADELRLWLALLNGELGPLPEGPVVLLGDANNDPKRGEGHKEPIKALLTHPRLQDPLLGYGPTVHWQQTGPMRVDYILPDVELWVQGAGVSAAKPEASRHRLVWVDLQWRERR